MPLAERQSPYIWVTWLTKLLTGANSCEWASWFMSHYQFEKEFSNNDVEGWERLHTEYMGKTIEGLNESYPESQLFVEGDNAFSLRGKSGTVVAGKPDIIIKSDSDNTIYDVKTGNPQTYHKTQVLIYMWVFPQLPQHKGINFDGVLAYKDHMVHIPANDLTGQFIGQLTGMIKRVASRQPALKVPSPIECRNCKITSMDCPEKKQLQKMEAVSDSF